MMTKDELKMVAEVMANNFVRERASRQMSNADRVIFENYFTPSKLQDSDNWTDEDLDLFISCMKDVGKP
jgi:hypothetical protein